jgi:hypothetical protein
MTQAAAGQVHDHHGAEATTDSQFLTATLSTFACDFSPAGLPCTASEPIKARWRRP